MTLLTLDIASRFATLTLSHLGREYPFKMDLVLIGPNDRSVTRRMLAAPMNGGFPTMYSAFGHSALCGLT